MAHAVEASSRCRLKLRPSESRSGPVMVSLRCSIPPSPHRFLSMLGTMETSDAERVLQVVTLRKIRASDESGVPAAPLES